MKIPYLDLKLNDVGLEKSFEKILEYVLRIIGGPEQQEFEDCFANGTDVKYVIAVSVWQQCFLSCSFKASRGAWR